jgi:hypothetical protein
MFPGEVQKILSHFPDFFPVPSVIIGQPHPPQGIVIEKFIILQEFRYLYPSPARFEGIVCEAQFRTYPREMAAGIADHLLVFGLLPQFQSILEAMIGLYDVLRLIMRQSKLSIQHAKPGLVIQHFCNILVGGEYLFESLEISSEMKNEGPLDQQINKPHILFPAPGLFFGDPFERLLKVLMGFMNRISV